MAKSKAPKQTAFSFKEEPPAWKKSGMPRIPSRADELIHAQEVAKRLSRESDPAPSKAVAEQAVMTGIVQGDCQTILDVLAASYERNRGPRGSMTAKEIAFFANWLLGSQPNNVRVSRRMASMTSEQVDKKTNEVTRGVLIVVTGERPSFDRASEPAITSYARIDKCCGQVKNWVRLPLPSNPGAKPLETRVCRVCDAALGVGYSGPNFA